ncbi:MAG: HlyD family efflux transporter periplasmic adaptor subunit, partial [Bacteroidetes bacterium]|nr:HlyD family efflux transporter periplasmic adaptor subunit [Bacteroidota bacterium]
DVRRRVQARLQSRKILAPIAGQGLRYEFVPGELVQPDRVIYEIFGGDKKILKLRVPERYATMIHPGQEYRAELKSYGGIFPVWFRGKVIAMRNVIQTSNGQTYRSAYCDFDPENYTVPPGTTVEAEISVGRSPLWKALIGIY